MSFWKKWFGRAAPAVAGDAAAEAAAAPAHAQPSRAATTAEQLLERLRHSGRPGGASLSEALAELRSARGAMQGSVLEAALIALQDGAESLDPLRLACASLLDQRGENERALSLVKLSRSAAGLMMAADMHAAAGDISRAVGAIERVMARDIDMPGARERHQRWCEQLGRALGSPVDDGATVVGPSSRSATDFRLLREVARGGAGAVYEAEDALLGRRLAYKVYHQPTRDRDQLLLEARIPAQLFGPGVVRVFDCDPERGWIAYEWAAGGSLKDRLRSCRDELIVPLADWLPKLVEAVGRVHAQRLVHADLKPDNVLFRGAGEPILSDFGLCRSVGSLQAGGTPGYMSPERLAGGPADQADDVYAIGRIIEDALNALDANQPAASSQQPDPQQRHYAALALRCLAPAAERPTAAQLHAEL